MEITARVKNADENDGSEKEKGRSESALCRNPRRKSDARRYSSLRTTTLTLAVTSRCSLIGTSYSPIDLDRIGEHDLALVDGVALGRERLGNVRGGDRAEQLIAFAGLAGEFERNIREQSRQSVCAASFSVASFFAKAARIFSRRFMLPAVASSASLRGKRKFRA